MEKFKKIGEYKLLDGKYGRTYIGSQPKKESIVYMLVCEGEVEYIGKTIQGVSRALGYINGKDCEVKSRLRELVDAGKIIDVMVRNEGLFIEFEGYKLDIAEALEQAMIKVHKPRINKLGR